MKVGHLARYLLCLCLYYSGVYFMVHNIRRAHGHYRVVILAYHSFSDSIRYLDMAVPPSLFMEQVRYLRKTFSVRTLSNFLAVFHSSSGISGDSAVITIDDGYADNFRPLVEAVEKFGAPSTVFLTTDCIDRRQPTSVMWIMLAVHHATVELIDLPDIGIGTMRIRTPMEKESAIRMIDGALKPLSPSQRTLMIERLLDQSGAAALVREFGQSIMLQWEQVQLLRTAGVEFGGHTLTHPVLSLLDPAAVLDEIDGSIQRVKEMTGVEMVTFAYPYGSDIEVSETVVDVCRRSGASAAVMLVKGKMPGDDYFRIPRMLVTSDQSTTPWGGFSRAMWACELEGLIDVARNIVVSVWKTLLRRSSGSV